LELRLLALCGNLTAVLPRAGHNLESARARETSSRLPKVSPPARTGTLDFYVKAMSRDGRVGEGVVRELINEQRELLNEKNEISLNQVSDFGPLKRVIKELNLNK